LIVGVAGFPEAAEELAADEIDFFPVVYGSIFFEAVVEVVKGAAQSGCASDLEWFGHSF
jgi:hypothetical protein